VSVELRIDSIWLNLDTAIPFGLILNELISNSLKHAFPDERRGVIQINLTQLPDGWIELLVKDNGVGMPTQFEWSKSASLGSRLIRILADQLQGQFAVRSLDGVEFRLTFKEVKPKSNQPLTPTA
jgi:two-component sensor histidine kinase